jgi:hypothetical protein
VLHRIGDVHAGALDTRRFERLVEDDANKEIIAVPNSCGNIANSLSECLAFPDWIRALILNEISFSLKNVYAS